MKTGTQQVATGFGHYVRELEAMGLTRPRASKIGNLITLWTRSRGPNGCLDYLDALGETLKSYLYNLPRPTTKVWITTDPDGFPRCLSFLKSKVDRTTLKRIVSLKRLVRLKSPSRAQVKKFTDAVTGPIVGQSVIDGMLNNFVLPGARHFRRTSKERYIRPGSHLGLYPIKAIGKSNRKRSHSALAARNLFSDLLHLMPLWNNEAIKTFFSESIGSYSTQSWVPTDIDTFVCMVQSQNSVTDGIVRDDIVGNIGTTQEPGGKLRCFASPRTCYQVLFTPLFDYLMDLLAQLPEDCTKDQESGALYAHELISQGKTVHAVDLGNATDRFPYALQRAVLRYFGVQDSLLEVLDFAVKGTWKTPRTLGGEIKWSQGQPLGLLPSFAMFALTHHFLIRGIYLKLGKTEFDYRLLGDDVIIGDGRVAEIYKSLMEQMSVSISPTKSYVSSNYAEFAGYQIGDELFRPGKFREPTPRNVLAKLKEAKNPYVYMPKGLIEPALIHEAFPYGLRVPEDFEIEKYPLETLKVLYRSLMVSPKEYVLSTEIAAMMSQFYMWRSHDYDLQFQTIRKKVEHIDNIDIMMEPQYTGELTRCRDTLNRVIQALLFCDSNVVDGIKAELNKLWPDFKVQSSRVKSCRFVAQLYPGFDFGSTEFDKRLNMLARFHNMEFSVTQLSRLLRRN